MPAFGLCLRGPTYIVCLNVLMFRILENSTSKNARGALPHPRAQAASPIFRASLVQTSASLRPFHLPLCSRSKGGDTPQLALATPRLRQEAFGMYVQAAARFKGKGQYDSPRRKQS